VGDIQRGDVVRCYALPTRRRTFRHATVLRVLEGGRLLRVQFDCWKEATVPAEMCQKIERLRFRWKYGRKVPVIEG
jgi:hypothetical protein